MWLCIADRSGPFWDTRPGPFPSSDELKDTRFSSVLPTRKKPLRQVTSLASSAALASVTHGEKERCIPERRRHQRPWWDSLQHTRLAFVEATAKVFVFAFPLLIGIGWNREWWWPLVDGFLLIIFCRVRDKTASLISEAIGVSISVMSVSSSCLISLKNFFFG